MATQVKNTFVGNGSTVFYSFTFPYIKPADVVVSVNSAITTEYSFANATTIQFNSAPSNGAKIVIYRDTDDSDIEAVFFPGSAIRARDLNDNFTQSLYIIQESNSEASDASDIADEAIATANEAKAQAQAAETKADSAISTSNSADAKATTALSNSSTALSAATSAEAKADAAVATANEAKSLVDGAVADSSEALSTANQAIAAANRAETNSSTALSAATRAETKADNAVKTADEADENADLAIVVATNALTIADGVAQSGEPFGQLYNSSTGAAGSKVIDLGDLAPVSNTGHFPNEDQGVNKYTCSEGTGTFDLGTAA